MHSIGLFFCLAFLATFTSGVKIQCIYTIDILIADGLYTCWVTRISMGNPLTVTEISGAHEGGRSNADVKAFAFFGHEIHNTTPETIPKGIENFFANLEVFRWVNGSISTIDSTTFKPFPNLFYINLSFNKLVSLDGDLFQHTRKLERIDFNNNLIKHVGRDLLTGLTNLTVAFFFSNPCINAGTDTLKGVQALKLLLPQLCPPFSHHA